MYHTIKPVLLILCSLCFAIGVAQAAWILADSFEQPAQPQGGANGNLWDQMHWQQGKWQ